METDSSAIFEGLDREQARAVECVDGPVLIVAGAGSGKTRVLTCRIARILEKGGDPSRILALTFTKKAAGEMKERIAGMVGPLRARRLCMGTFHSVFIRFLRDYAETLGYPSTFTVYDRSDSEAAVKTCVRELGLDDKVYKPREILSRISMAKNNLVTAKAYASDPLRSEEDGRAKRPRLGEVYSLYADKCRLSGVMDFDDILVNMNILLRDNPAAADEIASRFDWIMVDEYQDTNYSQYLIIKRLSRDRRNICVVGDDSQSIYAFRGARIENILSFRKDYPDCRTFRLERNYRSTRTIVGAANSLIARNAGRIPKECYSEGDEGEKIHILKAYTEADEANAVVSRITSRIMSDRAEYRDFAVLYRTNAQSRAIEETLRRRNMPYTIYSGNSFYERAEVKDMMAYFKLTVNPCDDESFRRVVNRPARGIGDTSLAALTAASRSKGCSLMEAASAGDLAAFGLRAGAVERIRKFTAMMRAFSGRAPVEDAHSLAVAIAVDSGLYLLYKGDTTVEGQAKAGNVEELLNSVKVYCEDTDNSAYEDLKLEGKIPDDTPISEAGLPTVTLSAYLENVSLLSAVDIDPGEDAANRIALMTAHSAKGLEFPYVVIAGMEENLFPSGGWMASPDQIEEERRLFYVALTRAKKAVWLSYAESRMRNGRHESNPPSRFLTEIDSRFVANPISPDDGRASAGIIGRTGFSGTYGRDAGNTGDTGYTRTQTDTRTRGGRAIGGMPARLATGNFAPTAAGHDAPGTGYTRPGTAGTFIPDPVSNLRKGQRVEHNKFGPGVIRDITPDLRATVDFDRYGVKTLLLQYAKLRVLSGEVV